MADPSGRQTIGDLIAILNFTSYSWNRDRWPSITPAEWRLVFGDEVYILEPMYQQYRRRALTEAERNDVSKAKGP